MDPQRLKEAYERLDLLDDRLTHKIRPRTGGSLTRPSSEQLEEQLRDLASYTIELKDILRQLFLAFAAKPGGG
jgi:hypothetical protein